MIERQWEDEADFYRTALITDPTDVHFGVGIPGNSDLDLVPRARNALSALDVGCGSGENAVALTTLGYSVVGIDPSARQIALAERLASKSNITDKPRFLRLPAERVEEVDGIFNVILSAGVMHFCADLPSIIHKIRLKLADDGLFILSLPHPIDMIAEYTELESDVEITLGTYFPSRRPLRGSRYWSKFGGTISPGYVFSEYVYTVSDIINSVVAAGLNLKAFFEPVCDHKSSYPCRFRTPSESFVNYYSPRVPQYGIFVARNIRP